MILINYSHPLTPEQIVQIEAITNRTISRFIPVPTQFDNEQPYAPQLQELVKQIPLSPEEWQTSSILIILPALNYITALLLADLHGRIGHFPTIIRTRPLSGNIVTVFEVAEIINLQEVRENAREFRRSQNA